MNIVINTGAPLPIYAQLMEQIKELIYSGYLDAGANLPSVRQLAEKLEINSLTIQKAYKGLEAEGVIEIKKGVGAFVSEAASQQGKQKQHTKLKSQLSNFVKSAKNQQLSLEEVIELIHQCWKAS